MQNTIYGYIRVSTKEQNEARQKIALQNFPVREENIFMDRQSGKDFNRTSYRKLLKKMRKKDILVIQSIDRLGRNYEEILEQWRILTRERQIDIVVLDMPLLDTRDKNRDLTGTFMADLILQVLSYVAQNERENIRKRQAEGIAAAKERGVHFGNPGKPVPVAFEDVAGKWRRKEISLSEALRELEIGRTYFYKNVKLLGL
ncbi:recombinase family protein [bacterium 1xD8-48]|nr:recombinase family protein [bacterium 1xD8-48]